MIIKSNPIQDAMLLLNFSILLLGVCLTIRYNPMNYGCNVEWGTKFKISLFIVGFGLINLIYFWLV